MQFDECREDVLGRFLWRQATSAEDHKVFGMQIQRTTTDWRVPVDGSEVNAIPNNGNAVWRNSAQGLVNVSDGLTYGDVVIGAGASQSFGDGDGQASIGNSDPGHSAGNTCKAASQSADEICLVQKREDCMGAICGENAVESIDCAKIEGTAAVEGCHWEAFIFEGRSQWTFIAEADNTDIPVFLFQAARDANERFLGTADIQFCDDHGQFGWIFMHGFLQGLSWDKAT